MAIRHAEGSTPSFELLLSLKEAAKLLPELHLLRVEPILTAIALEVRLLAIEREFAFQRELL